ncbi:MULTISPECIES: glutamate 5-kinase [unclassified Mesorhizobium]|jgi:glutamate 5-kinase|uniref:glutamate 5-kinase n=2 Tax=Mesorhizobium TaxID=68287 RepID=UPI000FCB3B79|nr:MULTISPECIES: glutamate 5-kinase [unclassified Mesorhizobium]RUT83819.1 glutamate 5-kinase [Mesorhizobium sp. M7A.T.Ca.US.000.02.1.1]RUT94827.1 glutamate 5-kinase [Mesorhizobium sp. M7A.T.Ca.US.000.02.2.1]RUU06223.1 glutamate 5-kinase [Mesorhizobium sp. M7A.T.Ca.TU.009.02.1.1]RUU80353.1 glutamate 5-kinase [Mesorhizobium sp. M7A.F.Ca.MR.362.00.0.0]RUV21479.1 glutamate 5-kinase [Mesorhizobium sp. M7A.F.Ca.MR.245.00.0.0]
MQSLGKYRRITVKIGSALLVDRATGLKRDWLASLADDIAALAKGGAEILVVSSGAIALGRTILGLGKRALKLEESQAAAAVGQIALAGAWSDALGKGSLKSGQILLTLGDTEERRRYLNARATISTLLKMKAVPVINENDTVATSEIRYGDNDRLAARVATMMGADLLVLLSDIDGLYTAPPARDPQAKFIPVVDRITPDIEAMAGAAASELSRGGMRTKLDAGKIATAAGTAMIITSGTRLSPLMAIERGERATFFRPSSNPVKGYKTWIAGQLEPAGRLTVDAGAIGALLSGKSLLPAGVKLVSGNFSRGDTVAILSPEGREIARGLVAYDAADAVRIAGLKTTEIETVLGYEARSAMIHRDDLVVSHSGDQVRAGDQTGAGDQVTVGGDVSGG